MKGEIEDKKKGRNLLEIISRCMTKKILAVILILAVAGIGIFGIRKYVLSESETTKIGFEDIGELVTQASYCTQVNVTDSSRELFGAKIPFTQSKYIYSYGVTVKAGFDFEEIEWEENGETITIKLPEAKVMSSEIDLDSFKVYHEDESIFNQITLEDNQEALGTLIQTAEEESVQNGLLENARSNAEEILKGFFGNVYDLNKYEIVFQDK